MSEQRERLLGGPGTENGQQPNSPCATDAETGRPNVETGTSAKVDGWIARVSIVDDVGETITDARFCFGMVAGIAFLLLLQTVVLWITAGRLWP